MSPSQRDCIECGAPAGYPEAGPCVTHRLASLPPSAETVVRALSRPGQLSWQQLLVAVRPMTPEAMEQMVELLEDLKLVVTDDCGVSLNEVFDVA